MIGVRKYSRSTTLYKQSYHDDSPRCFDDDKAQRVVSRLKNQAFKISLKDSRIKWRNQEAFSQVKVGSKKYFSKKHQIAHFLF